MFSQLETTALRRLHPNDVDPFLAYRSDPDVARFQSWEATDHDSALQFLTEMCVVQPLLRPGKWVQIGVVTAQDDALIGDMGWFLSEDRREAEIGISLAGDHQGKGHATRAVQMALQHIFENSDVRRIVGFADLRNLPSRALLRRSGFASLGPQVFEGVEEEAFEFLRPI